MDLVIGHPVITQVVFVGPYGVGKTTAVRTLSDVPVLTTESNTSMQQSRQVPLKPTTTVGIDYGEWTDGSGHRHALIGTPGQTRFSAMRRTALVADAAVVLWLYGNRRERLTDADQWLTRLGFETELSRVVVAVTRIELGDGPELADYRTVADKHYPGMPVLAADPRGRLHVARVVEQARANLDRARTATQSHPGRSTP